MLTAQLMQSMDDRHLVASLYAEQDPLTSSAAEIELLARLEALLDERNEDLKEAADEYELDARQISALGGALIQNSHNTVALLEAIAEAGIDDPASLKADFDLVKKFRALTSDAGDVFTRLSQLTTEKE